MMDISSRQLLDMAYSEFYDLYRKHVNYIDEDVRNFVHYHIGRYGEQGDTTTLQSTQLNNIPDTELADADHCLLVTLDAMFYFFDVQELDIDYEEGTDAYKKEIQLAYYITARNHLLYYGITIPRPGELLGDNNLDIMAELSGDPIKHYLTLHFNMDLVEDKLDLLLKIQPTNGPVDYSKDDYEDEDDND